MSESLTSFERINAERWNTTDPSASTLRPEISIARIDFLLNYLASGKALREDDLMGSVEDIIWATQRRLSVRNLFLAQKGAAALHILNALQKWLDDSSADHPERRNALYLLVQLANASRQLPQELFIGLTQVDRLPQCKGGSGLIFFGRHGDQAVAVKRIYVTGPASEVKYEQLNLLRQEILVWRQLRHPRILRLLGVEKATDEQFSIVSVRVESESLKMFVSAAKSPPRDQDRNNVLRDIAEGLEYLHTNKVIHGDIKPDNILVEFSGNRLRAILCDFGLSLVGDVSELRLKTHQYARGTKGWYDTVVEDRAEDGKWLRWRPSRDIYAFGLVCLWIIGGSDWPDAAELLQRGAVPSMPHREDCALAPLSYELWAIALACWIGPPEQRPNATYLVSFFTTDINLNKNVPRVTAVQGTLLNDATSAEGHCLIPRGAQVEVVTFLPNKCWHVKLPNNDVVYEINAQDVKTGMGTMRALHDSSASAPPDRLRFKKGDIIELLAPVKHLPAYWTATDNNRNVGNVDLHLFEVVKTLSDVLALTRNYVLDQLD